MNMIAPSAMPTLESVSRDATVLAGLGVFLQRRLAENLEREGFPVWKTEAAKTAFITASMQVRGEELAKQLAAFDTRAGGSAVPATPPPAFVPAASEPTVITRAPVTEQVLALATPAQGPTAVLPVTAPVAQEAEATQVTGRRPRTSNGASKSESVENGAVLIELKKILEAQERINTRLEIIEGKITGLETAQDHLTDKVDGAATQGTVERFQSVVSDLRVDTHSSMKIQQVLLGIMCIIGQNGLNVSGKDLLQMALSDADAAQKILQDLAAGKG